MPYRRRNFKRKKPLRKLAKRATKRKSAAAQSKQISTIAKHLSTLKQTVSKELTLPCVYGNNLQSPLFSSSAVYTPIIIPLTVGVSQAGTGSGSIGALPTTNWAVQPYSTTPTPVYSPVQMWDPIFQSRDLRPGSGQGSQASVPAWCKLYKQHVKLRFFASNMVEPAIITVSVVRANPDSVIENVKGIVKRLDGPNLSGPNPTAADVASYAARLTDYMGQEGVTFPPGTPAAPPSPIPQTTTQSVSDVTWNNNLWIVESQKTFVLGSRSNPTRVPPSGPPYGVEDPVAVSPSMTIPESNQWQEFYSHTVNYGGLKLSALPSKDGNSTTLDPLSVTSMRYDQIPPEHKRFLVIHSSNAKGPGTTEEPIPACPYMCFSTMTSARVPA